MSAENDTVVLEGTVASEDAKARAQALALKVHRIRKVDNRIEVKPPQPARREGDAGVSGPWTAGPTDPQP